MIDTPIPDEQDGWIDSHIPEHLPLPTVTGEAVDGDSGDTRVEFTLPGAGSTRFRITLPTAEWVRLGIEAQRMCGQSSGQKPFTATIANYDDPGAARSVAIAIDVKGTWEREGVQAALEHAARAVKALPNRYP